MLNVEQYVDLRVQRCNSEELQRKPNKWLASLPQFKSSENVLDIACGMGYDSFAWAREGKQPTAIDANWGLVRNASKLAAAQGLKINFLVADATRLPFRTGVFDVCFSENLLEHVPEWSKVVSEAGRVLKQDGALLVRCSNRLCPINYEINHMHFYPWLPDSWKRPILKWVQDNRPSWINYSRFPAVNWFTHRGLARSLRAIGFSTYEPFDLVRRESMAKGKRKLFFIFEALRKRPLLRFFLYPLMASVELVAIKKWARTTT